MTATHSRNVPSDSSPEILQAAEARHTSPAFIARPGFSRCPRCQRFWPVADFREDHAAFGPDAPQARCLDCRKGLKRALRQIARDQGVCEAITCRRSVARKYKCTEHYRLAAEAHARRAANRATATR